MNRNAKLLVAAIALVGTLTIAERIGQSSWLFYSLYPGIAASLLMTGGHGSTRTVSVLAACVEFFINVAAYQVVFATALRSRKWIKLLRT